MVAESFAPRFFADDCRLLPVPPQRPTRFAVLSPSYFCGEIPLVTTQPEGFVLMDCRATVPLRTELLTVLDEQIEMLTKKTFSSFTSEEMGAFKNREQRIRELQEELELVSARTAQFSDIGVFSAVYH